MRSFKTSGLLAQAATIAAAATLVAGGAALAQLSAPAPQFTQAQADAGRGAYTASCALCHGANLEGASGPALSGAVFQRDRTGGAHTVGELNEIIFRTMPLSAPGSLPEATSQALAAYILSKNGYSPGPLPLAAGNLDIKLASAKPAAAAAPGPAPDGFVFAAPPPKPRIPRAPNQAYPMAALTFERASTSAPTDADLANMADSDWLTFNRNYQADRYSPLSQINVGNATRLSPVCAFQLGEAGSFQNSPTVYKGRMYVTTSHRVFALDAATCKALWGYTYTATDPEHFSASRGLALYDGKLIKGTADGHLIALDAENGKLLWEAVVGDSALGSCVSGAAVAFRGKVFVGECGGDSGIRGHIHAYDANTGKPVWTFDTIPTGNQPGADTWGGGQDQGGGPSWSSMTIDVAHNLVLAPVGNPGPDFNGKYRPGDNLYTNSVVALDADTGKLAWYVQQIPHDTHDWDTAAAPTIFDRDGKRYMAEVSKNGYLYLYDRDTQKVLAKSKTQSRYDNFDTPLSLTQPVTYCPGSHGGFNGAAYSPKTNMLFTGAEERCDTVLMTEPRYIPGQGYYSGQILTNQAEVGTGSIRAFEATTGKPLWAYKTPRPVNGALTTTGGGLLLTGEVTGDFLVMDQKTGKVLYRFKTGGAIAGGASSYAVDGKQYIAVASGNTSRDVAAPNGAATVFVFAAP
jgi:PQQ-dependent dehydrogenase (methanol/ethanol family)